MSIQTAFHSCSRASCSPGCKTLLYHWYDPYGQAVRYLLIAKAVLPEPPPKAWLPKVNGDLHVCA